MRQLIEVYKGWNATAKIKTIVIGLMTVLALFNPMNIEGRLEPTLVTFIIGVVMIPLLSKFYQFFFNKEIIKPSWNDNPFVMKRPLIMFHTFSIFFIATGLCFIIGTGIKYFKINPLGLMCLSFGLGMILGIRLTLKLTDRQRQE